MNSFHTAAMQKLKTDLTYGIASLAAFFIGSLCQLVVVDWLVFGSPDGPMWVGFFAPLGFLLYVVGCGLAVLGWYQTRSKRLLMSAALNAVFICAFLGACFAYVVFALSIERNPV